MIGGPSEQALALAGAGAAPLWPRSEAMRAVRLAHDPTLGLDRSVCLRDVWVLLEREAAKQADGEGDVAAYMTEAIYTLRRALRHHFLIVPTNEPEEGAA